MFPFSFQSSICVPHLWKSHRWTPALCRWKRANLCRWAAGNSWWALWVKTQHAMVKLVWSRYRRIIPMFHFLSNIPKSVQGAPVCYFNEVCAPAGAGPCSSLTKDTVPQHHPYVITAIRLTNASPYSNIHHPIATRMTTIVVVTSV